jgi:hypothetical protein
MRVANSVRHIGAYVEKYVRSFLGVDAILSTIDDLQLRLTFASTLDKLTVCVDRVCAHFICYVLKCSVVRNNDTSDC